MKQSMVVQGPDIFAGIADFLRAAVDEGVDIHEQVNIYNQ